MRRFTVTVATVVTALALLAAVGCQGQKEGPAFTEIVPGLSYVDSTVGTGPEAGPTDFVVVNYTGWVYTDGQKSDPFDSSYDRGEPISFPLGRSFVIEGWEKGLVGMKVGGKRTLVISPDLAYGEQGRPPVIPQSATLMFDIELVDLPRVEVETLEAGTGPVAELGDALNVHYTGWLWEDGAKGAKFDSSVDRGQPFQLTLGQGRVIPGWEMALEGMKVGEKARLIIPSDLGYGKRGSPPTIPANATLCFEVELVSIEDK